MAATDRNYAIKKMYIILIIVLILALLFDYLNQTRFLTVQANTLFVITITALVGKVKTHDN